MWPRSQTSGLMIGECTRSRSSSLRPRDQRERARARLHQVGERLLDAGGACVGGEPDRVRRAAVPTGVGVLEGCGSRHGVGDAHATGLLTVGGRTVAADVEFA